MKGHVHPTAVEPWQHWGVLPAPGGPARSGVDGVCWWRRGQRRGGEPRLHSAARAERCCYGNKWLVFSKGSMISV